VEAMPFAVLNLAMSAMMAAFTAESEGRAEEAPYFTSLRPVRPVGVMP